MPEPSPRPPSPRPPSPRSPRRTMPTTVRPAVPEDVPTMHAMIVELADYERARDEVVASEADLAEALFGARPAVFAHVAACARPDDPASGGDPGGASGGDGVGAPGGDPGGASGGDGVGAPGGDPGGASGGDGAGAPVGFALWFRTYSTWVGRHGIYLEDLYVRPDHRGHGHGTALLGELAATCVRYGYRRLEWSALDWNTSARGFYESLGASARTDWVPYRLDGEDLVRLAGLAGSPVSSARAATPAHG